MNKIILVLVVVGVLGFLSNKMARDQQDDQRNQYAISESNKMLQQACEDLRKHPLPNQTNAEMNTMIADCKVGSVVVEADIID